jgi:phthiocerol/phenolphthiocerol synthesis type-I polyketide synthase E
MLVCADAAEACRQLRTSDGSGEGEAETAAGPALHVEAAEPLTRARLEDVGRRWLTGAPIQWSSLYSAPPPRRVPLPPYPFARRRHWIDPLPSHRDAVAALMGASLQHPTGLPHDLTRRIAAIWEEVLGIQQISDDDRFVELGGDSALAVLIVSKAREAGIAMNLEDLVAGHTVADLAASAAAVAVQNSS